MRMEKCTCGADAYIIYLRPDDRAVPFEPTEPKFDIEVSKSDCKSSEVIIGLQCCLECGLVKAVKPYFV